LATTLATVKLRILVRHIEVGFAKVVIVEKGKVLEAIETTPSERKETSKSP
jgi:hypothetical protein